MQMKYRCVCLKVQIEAHLGECPPTEDEAFSLPLSRVQGASGDPEGSKQQLSTGHRSRTALDRRGENFILAASRTADSETARVLGSEPEQRAGGGRPAAGPAGGCLWLCELRLRRTGVVPRPIRALSLDNASGCPASIPAESFLLCPLSRWPCR